MTLEINTSILVAYICILVGGFLVGLGFKYVGKVQDHIGVIYSFSIGGILTIIGVIGLLIEEGIIEFI